MAAHRNSQASGDTPTPDVFSAPAPRLRASLLSARCRFASSHGVSKYFSRPRRLASRLHIYSLATFLHYPATCCNLYPSLASCRCASQTDDSLKLALPPATITWRAAVLQHSRRPASTPLSHNGDSTTFRQSMTQPDCRRACCSRTKPHFVMIDSRAVKDGSILTLVATISKSNTFGTWSIGPK